MTSGTDFLTYLNSSVNAFRKTVYLDELAAYPCMMQAPVFSLIPHNQSYITDITKWKADMGTADGISFGGISLNSPVIEGQEASVTMKLMYQTLEFDRFSMKIMTDPKASAINLAKKSIEKAALERAMTLEGVIVNSSTSNAGAIGTATAVVDNTGGSYTITLSSTGNAPWAWGKWRRRLMVQIGTSTDIFDVENVDDINHTVTVVRRAGFTYVPQVNDSLYRQGSSGNLPIGLAEIIEGTGTLFGITRQHGWQSLKVDWTSIPIDEQALLELYIKIYQRSGEYPDMLITSPQQFLRLQQLIRDRSLYIADAFVKRTGTDGRDMSFNVPDVCYISLAGRPVKVVAHAHMAPGSGYYFNTDHLELVSVGSGDFVSPLGNSQDYMLHMGNITGNDRYRMMWAYYYAIRCDRPEAQGGFVNAPTSTKLNLF